MKELRKPTSSLNKNYDRPFRSFSEFAMRPDNLGDENKRHPMATQPKAGTDQKRGKAHLRRAK